MSKNTLLAGISYKRNAPGLALEKAIANTDGK